MKRREKKTFSDLTWADLEAWAGAKIVSRGTDYKKYGYVKDLATTVEGGLLALVRGSDEYAAKVLKKVRQVMANNSKTAQWQEYLKSVREANRRKPRLMQILNTFDDKPIILYSAVDRTVFRSKRPFSAVLSSFHYSRETHPLGSDTHG